MSPTDRDDGERGLALLRDPVRNRGTAFTEGERAELSLSAGRPSSSQHVAAARERG